MKFYCSGSDTVSINGIQMNAVLNTTVSHYSEIKVSTGLFYGGYSEHSFIYNGNKKRK